VDAVVLAVKTFQLEKAASQIGPMLGKDTVVLPLQNGVEATDQLSAILGKERVLVGSVRHPELDRRPRRIRSLGGTHFVRFGEPDDGKSERVEQLQRAFTESGIRTEVPDDVHAALWEKFLFVVPVGGVGAVTRAPIGVTRALPETRAVLQSAMQEIADLARAGGVRLREDIVARALQFMDGLDAAGTSSLQRDLAAGRPPSSRPGTAPWCGWDGSAASPPPRTRSSTPASSPSTARPRALRELRLSSKHGVRPEGALPLRRGAGEHADPRPRAGGEPGGPARSRGGGLTRHDPWQVVSGAIYGSMLIVLYGASTLYHGLPPCRAKQVCRFLDHAAIFLLIAGT
jgi:2-dehydropantoate 2-reductase